MKALPQAVSAYDYIVIGQAEFNNRVPADKTTLARRHLFAHHPAVPATEKVDEAVPGDRLGTKCGSPVQRVALAVQKVL